MRVIQARKIRETVSELAQMANFSLRRDVLALLRKSYLSEKDPRARRILKAILDNASYARKEKLAICQDTGLPVVFLEVGQDVHIRGDLKSAVNAGIEDGYRKGCLRASIVRDPLRRLSAGYSPCVIHTEIVKGAKVKLCVLPKGFGCENKSALKMFKPTAGIKEIKRFIMDTVRSAGPDACPPYVVGVGIGGTADYAGFMAKKALLRKPAAGGQQPVDKLGRDLLKDINKLSIGPMGLGGKATCLAVNIETFPTHIAGLAVAVNISCHALRSASAVI